MRKAMAICSRKAGYDSKGYTHKKMMIIE